MTIPVVAYTSKNVYLLDEINKNIELMMSAGLIEKWQQENIGRKFMKSDEPREPKALTYQKILGCFHLLLLGCFCGTVVFASEFVNQTCKKFCVNNRNK